MTTPIIFLDIDGVLNDHRPMSNRYCGMRPHCIDLFNCILHAVPDARIVVSSAWRYIVLGQDMTLKGFEYLLLSHGLHCHGRVLGHTDADDVSPEPGHHDHEAWREVGLRMRAEQIMGWVDRHGVRHWVVLDDLPLVVPNLVQTDGAVGLTEVEVGRVVGMLKGGRP